MKIQVQNMKGRSGNPIPNQFEIHTSEGIYFQSYISVIAFQPSGGGKVILDENKWDYSCTTGKYRNIFLGENKKETAAKIKDGTYELKDLN